MMKVVINKDNVNKKCSKIKTTSLMCCRPCGVFLNKMDLSPFEVAVRGLETVGYGASKILPFERKKKNAYFILVQVVGCAINEPGLLPASAD